jgi:RHS repeat-associated protein
MQWRSVTRWFAAGALAWLILQAEPALAQGNCSQSGDWVEKGGSGSGTGTSGTVTSDAFDFDLCYGNVQVTGSGTCINHGSIGGVATDSGSSCCSKPDLSDTPVAFTINADKRTVSVSVTASVDTNCTDNASWSANIKVKARCCGSACAQPGQTGFGLGGGRMDYTASLGALNGAGGSRFGEPGGTLYIKAREPSLALATPEGLSYAAHPGVEVITDTNSFPRQFKTAHMLADVVTLGNYAYEKRFYWDSQVGVKVDGLYTVSGSPFKTIKVENPEADPESFQRLKFTETQDGSTKVSKYEYDEGAAEWLLVTGGGLRRESRSETWTYAEQTNRVETVTVRGADGNAASKRLVTSQLFPWGLERVEDVVDPGGAAQTTQYSYYTDLADTNNYRRLKRTIHPGGNWERYEYDALGRQTKVVSQFLDSASDSADNLNRVVEHSFEPVDGADDGTREVTLPRRTIETLLGTEVSRTYRVVTGDEIREYRCQTAGAGVSASDNLVTITKRYTSGAFSNEVQKLTHENGAIRLYEYSTNANSKTTIVFSGAPGPGGANVVDGTKTITVIDVQGNTLSNLVYDIASGLLTHSAVASESDQYGRPERIDYLGGLFETFSYDCCGLASKRDKDGIVTGYSFDGLKRVTGQIRAGITNEFTLDPEGRRLATFRNDLRIEGAGYDLAGRLTASTNTLGHVTTYSYTATSKTITFPDGSTRIEEFFQDGQLKSVTGTAVHGVRYEYGIESNQFYTKEIKLDANGADTSEWTKTYTDMVAQPSLVVHSGGASSASFHNNKGQLIKQTDPDGVTTLFAYNAAGEREYVAVDMNRNGTIDFAGTDRITRVQRSVVSSQGTVKRRTTATVYTTEGTGDTETVNVSETSADGLQSWSTSFGLTTHSQTIYAGSGVRSNIVTAADGSTTISAYQNDRLISVVRKDALGSQLSSLSYAYDSHGRQQTVTDARTGATTYTYDDGDRLISVSGNGQTTAYGHDSMGRQTSITLPDGGVVTNIYFPTGELQKSWGARTYPVEHTYDYAGRMKTMKTWRNFAGNSGTAVTTWNYDPNRGLLTSKRYDDNQGPDYTYTPAGRLLTRTWARGVTTTYAYNNAGELVSVDYSDNTPDVTYTFDRRGRKASASSAPSAVQYSYNAAGQLTNENHTAGVLSGITVQSGYDSLFRRTSLSVESAVSGLVSAVSYGYDSASRLSTVSSGPESVEYVYLANSSLLTNTIFKNNGSTVMTTTKVYDNLNRLTEIRSQRSADSAVISSHAYEYNAVNQRIRATLQDGSYWEYAYDSLGQVTNVVKKWSDNTLVAGQQFRYAYDDIGNRATVAAGGGSGGSGLRSSAYTANALNQYTERTVPNTFDVLGAAHVDATVTVNNEPTDRKGEYYRAELWVTNTASVVYQPVTIVGVRNNVGANGEDAVTTMTGHEFVAKTPEPFTYDADGNLTGDSRWLYTWDAENRLTSVESLTNAPTASKRKVEWTYDHQGRRIRQITYEGSSGSYVVTGDLKFVYDAWQNLAELNATNNAVLRSYVWELDLSGTTAGAGGVGGLLLVNSAAAGVHFAAYDGNGNVTALVGANDGTASGSYEYSPFGETLRATGLMANENPYRFSTKRTDATTGSILYEYRAYDPIKGRWLSRDPLQELGGLHLYLSLGNDPINYIDPFGLFDSGKFWSGVAQTVGGILTTVAGSAGILAAPATGPVAVGAVIAGAAAINVGVTATGFGVAKIIQAFQDDHTWVPGSAVGAIVNRSADLAGATRAQAEALADLADILANRNLPGPAVASAIQRIYDAAEDLDDLATTLEHMRELIPCDPGAAPEDTPHR